MDEKVTKTSALIVAGMASFLTPFMGSAVNIALPSIGREFAADAVLLNWIATSYLLAAAMFLVPFGRIADITGRKKIFTAGVLTYTLASFLSALAGSAVSLIVFRVLQGIGGAMIFGTGVAILTSIFPPGERGKALGINVAAVYLGLSLGPFFGGILTQQLGWRSVFFINIPLGALITAVILWKLKGEWAEARGEKFDFAGSAVYGIALAAVMFGFSRLPSSLGVGLIFFGVLGGAAFLLLEGRASSPVLDIDLFRKNRVFAFSNLAALINYSATFAVGFLLSLYLQYIKGMSPQTAGLILVAQPAVQALFSPFAGKASDRIEPRVVASAGMALTSFGLFLLISLRAASGIGFIVACLVLLGIGFALFSSPNTNAVMGSVEKKFYGVASATVGTMRLVGQTISMGVALMIFAVYIGRVQISPANFSQFLSGMKVGFSVFSALCFAGVFASLARGNRFR